MEIVLNGVISGIVLSFLVGPVFFSLIQTSIERGFRSGFFVAAGISLSDAMYISLCYLGIYQVFDQGNFREYLAYFGGIVLLLFGVYYLFVKNRRAEAREGQRGATMSPVRLILKGFIINGLSPMVLIFWLGTVGVATTRLGYESPGKAIPYFAGIVATVFLTDLIKAKLADKLRVLMTPLVIRRINIVVGVVMVIFGGRLIAVAGTLTTF